MKGRVLVAGFATRHVAQSAFRAGYSVYAVDHFCDQDLHWYTEDRIRFDELEDLPVAIEDLCRRYRFDIIVMTSGAEDIASDIPVCGTSKEKVIRFLDKLEMQHFFEELKVPVAGLAKDGVYPAMIKPRRGSGGWRNTVAHSADETEAWKERYPGIKFLSQQLVNGVPSSVCCVADGGTCARAIATNEQLLRGKGESAFGFCGSVTPFYHPQSSRMIAIAETIAAASGCSGTVGIDFVAGQEPHVIEINPRFQATVDTIEMAMACNLFQIHVDACRGILPNAPLRPVMYAARRILFAEKDTHLRANLKHHSPIIADIPWPETFFEKDQAITSVYGWGETREAALTRLDKNITTIQQYLR
jgi:predicted ATP-grasp superfamily ATP-dependent carboligase